MTQSLDLGDQRHPKSVRRLNRLPIVIGLVLVVVLAGVIIYGLASRGMRFGSSNDLTTSESRPASRFGDQLTQGIPDAIIGEPEQIAMPEAQPSPLPADPISAILPTSADPVEPEDGWRERLEREQNEQLLRELQRQRMASIQADGAAYDSPIKVSLDGVADTDNEPARAGNSATAASQSAARYGAAQLALNPDSSGQRGKQEFFNQDIADLGYLPNRVVGPQSPFELKRGSVIPATLITGINSDLPGRIIAQVSQNVFDSATGGHLLIPQGARLFGRYDSEVAFGQDRVLVIWTDIVFPDGASLQIGGMAGTDAAGYGGFTDEVDTHFFETFGSAILVALIGAGTEMLLPEDSGGGNGETALQKSFAETFNELSSQTTSRNMDVQPTLSIRPGYRFNVLVDQDMLFPASFHQPNKRH